jgi:hypothetical protein
MEPLPGDHHVALEDGVSLQSFGPVVERGSIQTIEDYRHREDPIVCIVRSLREQELAHIGGSSSLLPGTFTINDSDIDLEEQMEPTVIALQRMVSPTRAAFFVRTAETFSEAGNAAEDSQPFQYQGNDGDRSSWPGTGAAACDTSNAGSRTPLLV